MTTQAIALAIEALEQIAHQCPTDNLTPHRIQHVGWIATSALTALRQAQQEPASAQVTPSSQRAINLALEGMEIHDHNAPEYIISAELVRINKALSGQPTPPAPKESA